MKYKNTHHKKGFVALIASIMLSLILLGLTLRVSGSNFSARTNSMTTELKQTSNALSRSCIQIALLRLREEYWYAVPEHGEKIALLENTCTILEVSHSVENSTTHTKEIVVTTTASYRGVYTTLTAHVHMTNPAFITPSSPYITLLDTMEIYDK